MKNKRLASVFVCMLCVSSWAAIPGDFDLNGIVDVNDIHILSKQWLGPPQLPSADIAPDPNGDGFVDFLDFYEFSTHWLATLPDPAEMIYLPGGQFQMGDSFSEGDSDELPVHTVSLDPFYMGKHEVTFGQYVDFLNAALSSGDIYVDNGLVRESINSLIYCDLSSVTTSTQIDYDDVLFAFSVLPKDGRDMTNDPVVLVSWQGAAAYCNWRSNQAGYQTCYNPNNWECDFTQKGYRLPTEAEWEYAARGGQPETRFSWYDPNTISHELADYKADPNNPFYDISATSGFHPLWSDNPPGAPTSAYTAPAGSFFPNDFGLYDMTGNVFEWCNDWYSSSYYQISPVNNPTGPASGPARVVRGGSWNSNAPSCRVAGRYILQFGGRRSDFGFRICLDLE